MKLAGRALLCLALAWSAGAAHAARSTERSKQKAAAEATRAGIAQKLSALKRDIGRTETEKETVADTLAESEEAISDANRSLHDLAEEQDQTNRKLAELAATGEQLTATITSQKQQLSKLLREQYVAGNEDRIKLLLSGDNPNRINRDLQLMAYVSQAQAKLLGSLRANLAAVEANRGKAQEAKDDLEDIAQDERDQKAVLEKEKAHHAALLGTLSSKLVAQRKEAGSLERDEQRLGALVDNLAKLIKQQAEAAAAEKRRLDALAATRAKAAAAAKALAQSRAQAERERLAREQKAHPGVKPPPFKPTPIDADEAPVAQQPDEAKPDPAAAKPADIALAPAAPDGAFTALRGQLRAPVAGTVSVRFGAKRGDGPSLKGVFIPAAEGSEVRAVALGRVVWANWMHGYGNLIIVDHGSGYWSLYGNNQSLLKHAGDAVKAGEPIAGAGNTGGKEQSGLYFELRHMGKPFDPAGWVKF